MKSDSEIAIELVHALVRNKQSNSFVEISPIPLAREREYIENTHTVISVARATEYPTRETVHDEFLSASERKDYQTISRNKLFQADYYRATYGDVANSIVDPLEHFVASGWRHGNQPNPFFDTLWYRANYMSDSDNDTNPLIHYIVRGDESCFCPSKLFDIQWYKLRYGLSLKENALRHYLENCTGPVSPIADFDASFYLDKYRDVAEAKINPFEHYLRWGYREYRDPSSQFNTQFYIMRHMKGDLSTNPLIHYFCNKDKNYSTKPGKDDYSVGGNVRHFTSRSEHFEEAQTIATDLPRNAKLIAFYLPQFHTFPENDRWWGQGFTEWTNLPRGLPRFHGHYQPRTPRDLGFYTLTDETMLRQIELAKSAGIHAFVFYYYWFDRKRLLERPLEDFLKNKAANMTFCLMWANESWTRRWDGLEGEVLISQEYSKEHEFDLIADFARHFADPRYMRIGGRPLLLIYRAGILPDARTLLSRWRKLFAENHSENPIIVMSQSFDHHDPCEFNFDGAIEFPPHKVTKITPLINHRLQYLDETFTGQVYGFDDVVNASLDEAPPDFPLIKTVVPSWDNDARRQGAGLTIHGSTPAAYEEWLERLIQRAQERPFFGEPIVCVNAWNEWCEGAYLEPDLHFGAAYLNATGRAAIGFSASLDRRGVVLIGHDAFAGGAQMLLLNVGLSLKKRFGVECEFLLLGGGKLAEEYRQTAVTHFCRNEGELFEKLDRLADRGFNSAIVNTGASGRAAKLAREAGMQTVLLVHELPQIIREKKFEEAAREGIQAADKVVFPGAYVSDRVLAALSLERSDRLISRPQGLYKTMRRNIEGAKALRRSLGISDGGFLALGVGYGDVRKGLDIFLQLWRSLRQDRDVHFCWVGSIEERLADWLNAELREARATGTFHTPGFREDVDVFFSAADAFALTSREDPFPTVALEAMVMQTPVFAFERTGGIPELIRENKLGHLAPYGNVAVMAQQIARLRKFGPDRNMLLEAHNFVVKNFNFHDYVSSLASLALPKYMSISAVVPNYNYASYLRARLASLFLQTSPLREIAVIDDASSDGSLEAIERASRDYRRDVDLIVNSQNSGSVFKQWRNGAQLARGDYVWIAEADDLSDPKFLAAVSDAMRKDPAIVMAFSDSRSIDTAGAPVYASYKPYYATVEPTALAQDAVFEGMDFIRRFLSVKNLILNVSSVLWKRDALLAALSGSEGDLDKLRLAGDWRVYLECLQQHGAKIAYVAAPLNIHRRHVSSVTGSLNITQQMREIANIHSYVNELGFGDVARRAQGEYIAELAQQSK